MVQLNTLLKIQVLKMIITTSTRKFKYIHQLSKLTCTSPTRRANVVAILILLLIISESDPSENENDVWLWSIKSIDGGITPSIACAVINDITANVPKKRNC